MKSSGTAVLNTIDFLRRSCNVLFRSVSVYYSVSHIRALSFVNDYLLKYFVNDELSQSIRLHSKSYL